MNYFVSLNILFNPNIINGIQMKKFSSDHVINLLKCVFGNHLEIINKLKI